VVPGIVMLIFVSSEVEMENLLGRMGVRNGEGEGDVMVGLSVVLPFVL